MSVPALILASGSRYRRALLEQLGVSVRQEVPDVDESPRPGEAADALARRLGQSKARAVAERLAASASTAGKDWIVIGSDQVCHLDGEIFGKPGNFERAREQLTRFSGRRVTFTTSLALETSTGNRSAATEDYEIRFRELSPPRIDAYLRQDQPWDCAGAIKVECAGVTLLAEARGRDINTLYGLPVMLLTDMLEALGHSIHDFNKAS